MMVHNFGNSLENEGRCSRDGVLHDIEQGDDIGAALQILENFDLSLDLLLLHGLQDFHDNLLVRRDFHAFEDLKIEI